MAECVRTCLVLGLVVVTSDEVVVRCRAYENRIDTFERILSVLSPSKRKEKRLKGFYRC